VIKNLLELVPEESLSEGHWVLLTRLREAESIEDVEMLWEIHSYLDQYDSQNLWFVFIVIRGFVGDRYELEQMFRNAVPAGISFGYDGDEFDPENSGNGYESIYGYDSIYGYGDGNGNGWGNGDGNGGSSGFSTGYGGGYGDGDIRRYGDGNGGGGWGRRRNWDGRVELYSSGSYLSPRR
jgi:hypothetical protein